MNWKCLHIWSSLYKPVVRIITTICLDLFEVGKKSNEFQIHEELLSNWISDKIKFSSATEGCQYKKCFSKIEDLPKDFHMS